MKPGDMIMFYAGWWHGTYVEKAPCLSMSMYWLHPNTSYMPRVRPRPVPIVLLCLIAYNTRVPFTALL
jgi:hypothetical protein